MREPSIYFSSLFQDTIWPDFAKTLKKEHSIDNYFTNVCQICDFLKIDFLEITPQLAQFYFSNLEQTTYTEKTVLVKLASLKSIYHFILVNQDTYFQKKLENNPFSLVKIKQIDNYIKIEDIPTLTQLQDILDIVKDIPTLFLAVQLAFHCSLTTTAICQLKPTQIAVDASNRGFIHFHINNKSRYVLIPDKLLQLIHIYYVKKTGEQDYLFYNKHHHVLKPRNLQAMLKKELAKAGYKSFTFQDIRNASIAYMLKAEASQDVIAKHAGITNFWMYRYNRSIPELDTSPVPFLKKFESI